MTTAFGVIMHIWQFTIIDEISNPDQIKVHIDAMTSTQRHVHAWMTATLDIVYPFTYGAFFIGMAVRHFGALGPWLALPGAAVIPIDLIEGAIQVMLLTGNETVIGFKAIVTPLKLGLFITAMLIALAGLGCAAFRLVRKNSLMKSGL